IDDTDIAYRGAGAEIADQPDILVCRTIDEEARDRVALAVQVSGEGVAGPDRLEPGPTVPGGRDGGIDVAAERIGARLVVVRILQVIDRVDQHVGLERGAAGDVAAETRLRRRRVFGGVN